MFKKVLIAFVVVIVAFLGYVAVQPSDFKMERTIAINATPEAIFPHVNDLKKFNNWNPWAKMDPNAKAAFDGAAEGVGARYSWQGNSKVGEGMMTVIASEPGKLVRIQLDFIKPMAGTNITDFTFRPEGAHTSVTWAMTGKSSFLQKAICVFMSMDKMVGGEFEKGLAGLKTIVESEGPAMVQQEGGK